jgi:hypothetical protein
VGVALHAWLCNIEEVAGDLIRLKLPEEPDPAHWSRISLDRMTVMLQFVLHKTMDPQKLSRLLHIEEDQAERIMDVLSRMGIITPYGEGLFRINAYLEPFLVEQLHERSML